MVQRKLKKEIERRIRDLIKIDFGPPIEICKKPKLEDVERLIKEGKSFDEILEIARKENWCYTYLPKTRILRIFCEKPWRKEISGIKFESTDTYLCIVSDILGEIDLQTHKLLEGFRVWDELFEIELKEQLGWNLKEAEDIDIDEEF